jgi:hypothetical protein
MFASNEVDRGIDPWPGLINDHEIGIWYFSAKHAV